MAVSILAAAFLVGHYLVRGVPIDLGVAKSDTCRRLCRKQAAAILDALTARNEFWSTIWPALAVCILVFT